MSINLPSFLFSRNFFIRLIGNKFLLFLGFIPVLLMGALFWIRDVKPELIHKQLIHKPELFFNLFFVSLFVGSTLAFAVLFFPAVLLIIHRFKKWTIQETKIMIYISAIFITFLLSIFGIVNVFLGEPISGKTMFFIITPFSIVTMFSAITIGMQLILNWKVTDKEARDQYNANKKKSS